MLIAPEMHVPVTVTEITDVISYYIIVGQELHNIFILIFLSNGPVNGSTETLIAPNVA